MTTEGQQSFQAGWHIRSRLMPDEIMDTGKGEVVVTSHGLRFAEWNIPAETVRLAILRTGYMSLFAPPTRFLIVETTDHKFDFGLLRKVSGDELPFEVIVEEERRWRLDFMTISGVLTIVFVIGKLGSMLWEAVT